MDMAKSAPKKKTTSKTAAKKKAPAKGENQLDLLGGGAKPAAKSAAKAKKAAPAPAPAPKEGKPAKAPRAAKGKKVAPEGRRSTAETMAGKQREISVSEFFTKNRHLLGFDNPTKALLTTIKEAVDNSLDACEEAGILPDLLIEIRSTGENRYRVKVRDNGPGIVKAQIPKIFGKLLYGSKFHRLKQSRGQQGIGISAAGMYGHLTTGKPITAISRTAKNKPAHAFDIRINTRNNEPEILRDEEVDFDPDHGTQVEIELEGIYKRGKRSVDEYLQATAVANPHCQITFVAPDGEKAFYPRAAKDLPEEAREIKPHPHGVELGMLMKILQDSSGSTIKNALTNDFSRVSDKVAGELLQESNISVRKKPRELVPAEIERLHKVIQKKQLLAPPTNCLSPIGEESLRRSLESRYECELVVTRTRKPAVYRGNPFQIEVGIAYGGKLPVEELAEILRLANRVPLQYQANACAIAKAVMGLDWKNYGLQQTRGAPPSGPMVICVHIASAWVPFTSESKEAIAHYEEIIKEMRLALQDCGRELSRHIKSKRRAAEELKKRSYIEKYIPHIGIALREILELGDKDEQKIVLTLRDTLERSRTRVQVKGNVELALAEELEEIELGNGSGD